MNATRKQMTLGFLLNTLKRGGEPYGYNIWIADSVQEHTLLWHCAVEILKSEPPPPYTPPTMGGRVFTYGGDTRESQTAKEIFPLALDILWLLARKGILRPGVREVGGQVVQQGQGYSLTLRGRAWIKSYTEDDINALCEEL